MSAPNVAAIAAQRLSHLGVIGLHRQSLGEDTPNLAGWALVAADALRHRDGRDPSIPEVRAHLPPIGRNLIDDAAIADAIKGAAGRKALVSNAAAGRMIGFSAEECWELAARGVAVSVWPCDETSEEREWRRACRRREMAAARQARLRARRKANVAIGRNAGLFPALLHDCNIPQPDRVLAAIAVGAEAPVDIARATGLSIKTIRPLLARLRARGRIVLRERGRYALPHNPVPAVQPTSPAPVPGSQAVGSAATAICRQVAMVAAPIRAMQARVAALAPTASKLEDSRCRAA